MKKRTMKTLFLSVALCTIASVGTGTALLKADAAEAVTSNLSADNFKVLGASIRIKNAEDDTTGDGIRFCVGVEKSVYEANATIKNNVRLLVMPTKLVSGTLDKGETYVKDEQTATTNDEAASGKWTLETVTVDDASVEYYCTYVYLWDIPDDFYDVNITARAYYTEDNGATASVYSTEAVRSFEYVAVAAFNDLKDTQDEGEDAVYKYAVTVDGVTKYSPYSETARNNIKSYLTENVEIENRSKIDLAKAKDTFELDVAGLALNGGEVVSASIDGVAFSSYSANGSTLNLSSDALKGIWGDANIALTYEVKEGEKFKREINVDVPVYIYRTINNKAELLALESYVTLDGTNAYGIFELTADIDLGGATFNGVGTYTGAAGYTHKFWGTFDGKGHTISNYTIEGYSRGLIACIEDDGVVRNVTLKNVTLNGESGIVSSANDGLIENVFVYAKILANGSSAKPASGIVSETWGTVRNVVVVLEDNQLYPNSYGGGIIGSFVRGTAENGIFINLDTTDPLYAIGAHQRWPGTVGNQSTKDLDTFKSFQGFEKYAAWLKADGATASWASWCKEMISEFVGEMVQPVVENESVEAGDTVTFTVANSTYVSTWSVDNDDCTIENGVLTIGESVAEGTTITVTVTALDGTERSVNVYVTEKDA